MRGWGATVAIGLLDVGMRRDECTPTFPVVTSVISLIPVPRPFPIEAGSSK